MRLQRLDDERAGVEHRQEVRPHDQRGHPTLKPLGISFAIQLVRSGLDLRRVQQLLGHSNLNTTQEYLQFNDQDLREVYNKIEF